MRIGRKYVPPLILLMVSLLGTAYAAVILTQHGAALPGKGLVKNCTTLTPNVPGVIPGSSGAIFFDCNPTEFGITPADSAVVTFGPGGSMKLSLTMVGGLGVPYTGCHDAANVFQANALCVYDAASTVDDFTGAQCNSITSNNIKAVAWNGGTFTFGPGTGNWDYCLEYGAPNLPTDNGLQAFDIQWSV